MALRATLSIRTQRVLGKRRVCCFREVVHEKDEGGFCNFLREKSLTDSTTCCVEQQISGQNSGDISASSGFKSRISVQNADIVCGVEHCWLHIQANEVAGFEMEPRISASR